MTRASDERDRTGSIDDYAEAVLQVVEAIPVGAVMSYGAIAEVVGADFSRGGPRQVAAVMRRYGASVPWWRVLRADGTLAPEVSPRQRRLLLDEGVPVHDDRVPRHLLLRPDR